MALISKSQEGLSRRDLQSQQQGERCCGIALHVALRGMRQSGG